MTKLAITSKSGMHLTFDNGITLSVQVGRGNYCANRALGNYDETPPASEDAEIAVWNEDEAWFPIGDNDTVRGWVPINDVLLFASMLKLLPSGMTPDQFKAFLDVAHFFKQNEVPA